MDLFLREHSLPLPRLIDLVTARYPAQSKSVIMTTQARVRPCAFPPGFVKNIPDIMSARRKGASNQAETPKVLPYKRDVGVGPDRPTQQ
jgi:hypothetical protein